jgi:hypothetical protein
MRQVLVVFFAWLSPTAAALMGLSALATGCGTSGNDGEVAVIGRVKVIGQVKNPEVTLEHKGQALAHTAADELGRFVLRVELTPDLEAEQQQTVGKNVVFSVSALYYSEIGAAPCTAHSFVTVRFRQGRWVDTETGKTASVLLQGFECQYSPGVTVCCSDDPRPPSRSLIADRP